MTGREVGTLVEATKQAGEHHIRFDANTLSSGVYFYQLQAGQFSETRKLLLIR
ncbi:MAG: T9SS type A sorting domain-containing protein [bacterium]|nr:T9SS type A sorting domain-containing protein [bacterium]